VAVRAEYKREISLGLKVAAGHLEHVRRMVDREEYCVDIMKQLAAVQASLSRVQQLLLRNHLSTCVSDAIQNGFGEELLDELMSAFKFETSAIEGKAEPPLLDWHRSRSGDGDA
jgi:DNA-binding FrmR family transcriptional regulator